MNFLLHSGGRPAYAVCIASSANNAKITLFALKMRRGTTRVPFFPVAQLYWLMFLYAVFAALFLTSSSQGAATAITACSSHEVLVNDICLPKANLNESCLDGRQCRAALARCLTASNTELYIPDWPKAVLPENVGTCQCLSGTTAFGNSCKSILQCPTGESPFTSPSTGLPERCGYSSDCSGRSVACIQGICCPKPNIRCQHGLPAELTNTVGGEFCSCPKSHVCLSFSIAEYSDFVCCPTPCTDPGLYVKDGLCLRMLAYREQCERTEECTAKTYMAVCEADSTGTRHCECPANFTYRSRDVAACLPPDAPDCGLPDAVPVLSDANAVHVCTPVSAASNGKQWPPTECPMGSWCQPQRTFGRPGACCKLRSVDLQ